MTKTLIRIAPDFIEQQPNLAQNLNAFGTYERSYKMADRLHEYNLTKVISLHLSESEIGSIKRILQYQAISRSELIQRKINLFPVRILLSPVQKDALTETTDLLITAANQNQVESALQAGTSLMALNYEINFALKLWPISVQTHKFVTRNLKGLRRTTSVRISSEAAGRLKTICWSSGLTITDVAMRLVMRREIPDRQLIKLKLLLQSIGLQLKKVDSQNPQIKAAIVDCRNSIQNICEVIRNDF